MKKAAIILSIPTSLFLCSLIIPASLYLTSYFYIQSVLFLSGMAALGISRKFKSKTLSITLIFLTILSPLVSDAIFDSRYDAQFYDFDSAIGSITGLDSKMIVIGAKYWVSYEYEAFGKVYQSSQPISKKVYYQAHFNCPIEIDFLKSAPDISRVNNKRNPEGMDISDCYRLDQSSE